MAAKWNSLCHPSRLPVDGQNSPYVFTWAAGREAKKGQNVPLREEFHRGVLQSVRNISDTQQRQEISRVRCKIGQNWLFLASRAADRSVWACGSGTAILGRQTKEVKIRGRMGIKVEGLHLELKMSMNLHLVNAKYTSREP